ncbi:MAG TPA: hypothetical protein VHB79_31180 [Polyangiaceae bacterium]|nr:hypothetical protein [Polyangiaceae bacterium]
MKARARAMIGRDESARAFVEKKLGASPQIDFLESPVMIDNRARLSA